MLVNMYVNLFASLLIRTASNELRRRMLQEHVFTRAWFTDNMFYDYERAYGHYCEHVYEHSRMLKKM